MPNKKISQFPTLPNITSDVEFAVVVSGDNYTVDFQTVSGTVINNIVFPDADVLGTRLSGFTNGLNQALSSGDTVLSAFEKLQVSKQDLLTVQLTGTPESLSFIDIDETNANVNIVSVSTGQTEINISTETSGATDSIILNENGLIIENELYGNTTSLILSDGFGISYTGSGVFNDVNGFYIKNPNKIYFPLSVISGDTLARLSDITGTSGTSLIYYTETSNPINILPIAQGVSSIAIGDGASALIDNVISIGQNAGYIATGASHSNFIGSSAGYKAMTASYSNFIGYQAGKDATTPNSIIIGNNITLPPSSGSTMNIGGVLFGSGLNDDLISSPITTETPNGKIGVRVVEPKSTLDINGSLAIKHTYVDMTTLGIDYTIDNSSVSYRFDYKENTDLNIIMPDPATCTNRIYYISRTKNSGVGLLNIIVSVGEIEDVDGNFTSAFSLKEIDKFQWISDGINWVLISANRV